MSEIEKICVHFKETGKVGNSEQTLYYCDARDYILGEDAKICFVCNEYKPSKNDFDEKVRQNILDYLNGKRKREGVRWKGSKRSSRSTSSRKSRDEYDEDDEEESEGDEVEEAEEKEEVEEAEEKEEGEEAEEKEEGEEAEEAEDGEEAEEAEEGEEGEAGKAGKKPDKGKSKKKPEKKPAAKVIPGKAPQATKAAKPVKPSKAAKPGKEVALEKEDLELYELIKSKGDEGIIQMNIKDESKLPSSKISKVILKLKDAGLIGKEMAKVKDEKGKSIVTNLIKAIKK
jgi:cobalamin biosynthesis protein CobT